MKKTITKRYLSKMLIAFAFLMSYTLGINAQSVADYSFNSSTGTYSEITGTTTGATGDDNLSAAINIGFTDNFVYNGIEYTKVKISTNGWMEIGTSQNDDYPGNYLNDTDYKCFLAPLWDDLHTDDVQYELSGTTPNQIFTVQWKNAEWNYNGDPGQNFQVKIYETTNVIEFVYGTMIVPNLPSASIGITDETGGSGHYISVTPADPPTISSTTANNSVNAITYLTSGQTYTFTPYVVYDQTSVAVVPDAQVTAGNVSSIADTEGEAVDVFKFKITDAGSGDAKTTIVKQITIKPHASNTADWTDQIQGVKLNDGSDITLNNVTISDTEIILEINSGDLVIDDATSKEITMSIYLNTSGIVDGDVLQFIIDYDAHGFASDYAGSVFATTFGAADIDGNAMTIDVTATKITYTTEPSTSVYINTNLDTPPVITAYDANDNIDLGFTETVTLSNSGLIAMTGNSVSAVAGVADFATLQFTEPGGPLSLTASSGSLTDAVSVGTITINNAPVVVWSEDFEGDVSAWAFGTTGQTNKWEHGTAEANGGTQSAYTSNDGGTTAAYTNGTSSESWLSVDVDLSSYSEALLSFWWKCTGENNWDYGEVYINDGSDHLVSGSKEFSGQGTWTQKTGIDISSYTGGSVTLKFMWKNDGSGGSNPPFCVDDIEISAPTPADMAYASSTVTQENTDLILAGNTDNEIVGIQVVTNNTANPISITNFSVNATGTTDINDIENAIIYYTGSSSVFDTEVDTFNLIAVAPVAGNFDISGDQELVAGTNYFWLTYGVKSSVVEGNLVDAECVQITVDAGDQTPTVTAPTGTRSIKLPLAGTKTIGSGGDYATFTDAINELNSLGIGAGGVTFNVTAGEIFNEVVPVITVTGTEANPIIFKNAGTPGTDNPTITGIGTGSADAGITLETVSYITFNGINIECQVSNDDNTKRLEYGYWIKGDASNNNITNCTVDLTKVNTSSKGIYMNGDNNNTNKFYNNTIQDCFSGYYFTDTGDGNEIGTTGSGISTITDLGGTGNDVYGIYIAEQIGMKIFNNNIHNLTTDNDDIYGIYSDNSINVIDIYNNKIYDISYTATTYSAYGIYFNAVSTSNVYNNMIYSINAENSDDFTIATAGIFVGQPGTQINMYFNTIYLDYTSGDASNKSAALYFDYNSSAPIIDLRNNIFINKVDVVTNGGTAYAFKTDAADYSKFAATTNYNLYYAGTPGANNLIFDDGTNHIQTLADYKVLVAIIEQQSITEGNTPFVSTTGTYDLHLNDANTTQCESGGSAIDGYIDDIDADGCRTGYPLAGQVNGGGTAPDIGADEGDFKPLDQVVPEISYTAYGNSASTTSRIISEITITDPSGINATTAKPRAYYKKSTNANAYNDNTNATDGWKYVEANGTTSPFDFTIDYSLISGGVAVADVIEYFIVAQDEATFPNLGINSGSFNAEQSSVDLATDAFPIGGTINSYEIVNAIAATVNVGDGEAYTSLTAAEGLFDAINSMVVNQNVTVNITSDLTEDGTNALNKLSEEGGNYTITIQPDAAVNRNVSGSYEGNLIRLSGGVDGIIFDGGLENNLTITNTSSSSCVAIEIGEASYDITVKNCNIATGGNSSSTYGIYASGADISNIIIQDNIITKAKYAIYLSGTFSSDNDGNSITGNIIGSDVLESRISEYGIFVEYQTNLEISGNEIFNVINPNNRAYGICLSKSNNVVISKNNLHDIVFTGSVGYTAYGIYIDVDDSDPVIDVVNNLIRHISGNDAPAGINIAGSATTGIGIYFNSIYLTPDSDHGLDHASAWAASIIVEDGISGIDLRNNILQTSVGKETASSYTSDGYAVYCEGTTMPFATIDNNIFYADNHDNNYVGYGNATQYADITTWKAWTVQDVNSLNDDPLFNSTEELSLKNTSPALDNGTPIAGITDDYAGIARDASTPSIGAYEDWKDALGPIITYTALDNIGLLYARSLTDVAITDDLGIVNISDAKPRVYYKKSIDANEFNDNTSGTAGWKFAEVNGTTSPFDFTIDYSLLNGGSASVLDTIQYFVVAQDDTENITANPSEGFDGVSVSVITSAPTTINSYVVKEDDTPIVTFSPADESTDIALDSVITLAFSRYMYKADGSEILSSEIASFIDLKEDNNFGDDVDYVVSINDDKDVITIDPVSSYDYQQVYYLVLDGNAVQDVYGNEITQKTITFTSIPYPEAAPEAQDVTISFTGTLDVGTVLTGEYTFFDINDDIEGVSTYKWYRADDVSETNKAAIAGATDKTYTVVEADRNKYITFEVTPVAVSDEFSVGLPVESPLLGIDVPAEYPIASDVSISGDLQVGETIDGSYVYSDINGDVEGATIFKWYRADDNTGTGKTLIVNANYYFYRLVIEDENKFILFEVTPVAETGDSLIGTPVESSFVGPILPDEAAPTVSNVTISGLLEVGETLTGSYDYSDVNDDVEGISTFNWYIADDSTGTNKTEIAGATTITYVIVEADTNKYISFKVTPLAQTGATPGTSVESSLVGPVAVVVLSTNAALSDLLMDGTTVTDFASGTYIYNIELPQGTTETPTVTATTEHAQATFVITPAVDVNSDSVSERATTVLVTAEDGTTTLTYTINFTVLTGVDELHGLSSQITVYPNPCNGAFTLNINNENRDDYSVEIVDIMGKVIYISEFKQVDMLRERIDISRFTKGIYLLKVRLGNETGIKRIIIE